MKKIYFAPMAKVVKIQPAQILAGSDLDAGGDTNQNLSFDADFEETAE